MSTPKSRLRALHEARDRALARGPRVEEGPFVVYRSEEPASTYLRTQVAPKMIAVESFENKSLATHLAKQLSKERGSYTEVWPAKDALKYMGDSVVGPVLPIGTRAG